MTNQSRGQSLFSQALNQGHSAETPNQKGLSTLDIETLDRRVELMDESDRLWIPDYLAMMRRREDKQNG